MQDDKELEKFLTENGIWRKLFDTVRLVKGGGPVYKCDGKGGCQKTNDKCYNVWGRNERCKNCVSQQAYDSGRQRVKIEYADGNYYMVMAKPVVIKGENYIVEFVMNIGDQLATGHDNSNSSFVMDILRQLEEVSSHDAFTGLYNKKYLTQKVEEMLHERRTAGKPLYLALWDIDKFKKVNDTYGHAWGDKAILGIADAFKTFISDDIGLGARFGGDEFVVMFESMDETECRKVLDVMQSYIANEVYKSDKFSFSIHASYGLADVSQAEDFLAATHIVDKLMYDAKTKKNKA